VVKIQTPHDRYVRALFSNVRMVIEFLRAYLPRDLLKLVDLSTLELQNGSFIDDTLKLKVTDVLYKVTPIKGASDVLILIEHQSTQKKIVPWRIANYVREIETYYMNRNKTTTIPFVYPLTLYTGKRPYTLSMDRIDLYEKHQRELARHVSTSPYPLIDLSKISEDVLKKYKIFGPMARTLKHIHDPEIDPFFKIIIEDLKELEAAGEGEYFRKTLSYIYEVGNVKSGQDLVSTASGCFATTNEDKAMTVAEMLRAEGREEGIQKGIQKGILEGKLAVALSMLQENLSVEAISRMSQLPQSKIRDLRGGLNS